MKILTLTNLYPPHGVGGYEERCRQVVEGLINRGHTEYVLTSTHGVRVRTCQGHVARKLNIHGFFGHPWRSIPSLFFLERHNQKVLQETLNTYNPDLVHVWNMGGISKSLLVTLKKSGLPVVYDISDYWVAKSLRADVWMRWWHAETGGLLSRLIRYALSALRLKQVVLRKAPAPKWDEISFPYLYFCSQFLKATTLQAGYKVAHGEVIYCGVDVEKFDPRSVNPDIRPLAELADEETIFSQQPSPESSDLLKGPRTSCNTKSAHPMLATKRSMTRLLYAGRICPDKDPLTAIRALAHLRTLSSFPFTLDLCGQGDPQYIELLKKEIVALNLKNHVRWRQASAQEMPSLYAQYDALLFTSAWEEPFALTPLEAMAARLPVISTQTGGSAELIRHRENGLAFPAGDHIELARQILDLAQHPQMRESITQTAYTEVLSTYDAKKMIDAIEKYLKRAAANSSL